MLLRFAPHLVDAVDWYKQTPLMRAVVRDRRDVAKMLLRAGADVRKKHRNGDTVFDMARIEGFEEMMKILNQHQQVSGIF